LQEGRFRKDFLDRIRRWHVSVPTLDERKDDIFLFVQSECGKHKPTPRFLIGLLRYSWPGNVRELLDVLRLAQSKTVGAEDRLDLDHLELDAPAVISAARDMDEEEAEGVIFRWLEEVFGRRGFRKNTGLHHRIGQFLGISDASVSNKMKKLRSSSDSSSG
jgi:transcriptional regulator with PAS, ATPase and Fis domain